MRESYGLLTKRQLDIIMMRRRGLTQREIANQLGTSRENVTMLEKRAYRNVNKARATLAALKSHRLSVKVLIEAGTHLVDIPRIMVDNANRANIMVKANFTRIYEDVRFKARRQIKGVHVIKKLTIWIMPDGDFDVEGL
jgi:Tfx family DNA-binding protein